MENTVEYYYALEPLQCQRQAYAAAHGRRAFGYVMDQGTGKTKATYDDAFNLAMLGAINALVVIAPNDVHRAWIEEELPKHTIPQVPCRAVIWDGKKTKKKLAEIETLFAADSPPNSGHPLRILAVNIEALAHGKPATNRAYQLIKRLLLCTSAMLVVDESQDIKTPKSQRTRKVWALGKLAQYRRILTGTIITQTPFDFYSQFRFLDPRILGFDTYAAFKAEYGSFVKRRSPTQRMGRNGQMEDVYYDELLAYKNIDQLLEKVKPHCFRVEKREALPDLPEKVYMPPRRVELNVEQKRMYKLIQTAGMVLVRKAALAANVEPHRGRTEDEELWSYISDPSLPTVVAETALAVYGKLRQIAVGIVRDSDGAWHTLDDTAPKLKALLADIAHNGEPAIIWCVYKEECEMVAAALRTQHGEASTVVFNGAYTSDQRAAAKAAFQDMASPVRFFVASYAAARGHTLLKATAAYYHTVHDSVEKRIQSEDRNHRAGAVGQEHGGRRCVVYTDYVVAGTVDEKRYNATMRNVRGAREKMALLKTA